MSWEHIPLYNTEIWKSDYYIMKDTTNQKMVDSS